MKCLNKYQNNEMSDYGFEFLSALKSIPKAFNLSNCDLSNSILSVSN